MNLYHSLFRKLGSFTKLGISLDQGGLIDLCIDPRAKMLPLIRVLSFQREFGLVLAPVESHERLAMDGFWLKGGRDFCYPLKCMPIGQLGDEKHEKTTYQLPMFRSRIILLLMEEILHHL